MASSAEGQTTTFPGALLLRGSALNVLTLIAGVAVGFFLMPFLIHALGDRGYGLWLLVGSITSYYALLDLGLTSAVNRLLAQAVARENETSSNAIIVTALAIFGGIGAIAFLLSVAVALGASWFFADPGETAIFRQVVVILGVDVALAFPFAIFNALLVAHYRFDIVSGVQLMALTVRTALILYFIGRGHSVLALAVITLAVSLASRLALAVAARPLLPSLRLRRGHLRRAQARALFGYGRYAFVAAAADRVRFQIDTVVVAAFLGVGLVTHYAIAFRVAQLFMELMIRALGVVAPVFARIDATGDREEMRRVFLLATLVSTLASVTVAGGIVVLGRRLIELWIGGDYLDAYPPLVILAGALAVGLMQMPSVHVLYAIARHRFFAYLSAGEALANLGLSLVLVQFYGMIGVALGTAIPLLIAKLFLQPVYVCRTLRLDPRTYYLEVGRTALLAASSQVPLLVFVHAFGISSLPMLLIVALIYYPLCWTALYVGLLREADRRRIGRMISARRWLAP